MVFGLLQLITLLRLPDSSLRGSKRNRSAVWEGTSTYSWHKVHNLNFLQDIFGQFFRSRLSFNITSVEMLLLLAGPIKDFLLKCFYKLYC